MSLEKLAALEDEVLDHVFSLRPGYAIDLGLHQYDGRLPDYSVEYLAGWTRKAKSLLTDLRSLSANGLDERRKLDREILTLILERALFELDELKVHVDEPLTYVFQLNINSYLVRDYAPAVKRLQAVVSHLGRVPSFLDVASKNLAKVLPQPSVKVAIDVAKGTLLNFDEADTLSKTAPRKLQEEFQKVKRQAVIAVEKFVEMLEAEYFPKAKPEFALGKEKYAKMLWVHDRIRIPLEQLADMGMKNLEQNKKDLTDTARRVSPSKLPKDVVAEVAKDHASAEKLVKETGNLLEEARQFTLTRSIVTIPSEERPEVKETPVYARAVYTAAMDSPGTFETGSTQAYYYVTPVDAKWPDEKKEEWLRYLNYAHMRNITIHEAYPGHYLHHLHLNHMKTKTAKAYWAYAFGEGWAHYCEQMAWEQKYREGDLKFRLIQLQDALVRNCRYMASIKMHAGEWTLEQATQFFMENAFVDRLPAEREALRGTYDPGYLNYTLGKLLILRARDGYFRKHPNVALKEFHDKLLALGAPPAGLLEDLLG